MHTTFTEIALLPSLLAVALYTALGALALLVWLTARLPRLAVSTALVVGAMGCQGPEYPMRVYVEVGQFELYQSTAKAAEIWNKSLGRTAVAYVSTGDERVGKWDCDFVRVIVEDPGKDYAGLCSKRALGPHCGVTIRIHPDYVGHVGTLVHELGHALGVNHNVDNESYMYESARRNAQQELLADDLLAADRTLDDAS